MLAPEAKAAILGTRACGVPAYQLVQHCSVCDLNSRYLASRRRRLALQGRIARSNETISEPVALLDMGDDYRAGPETSRPSRSSSA